MSSSKSLRNGLSVIMMIGIVMASIAACGAEPAPPPVRSYMQGTVTVRADFDSTQNYSGFEVLVAMASEAGSEIDTLGHATTDSTGFFQMDIAAPRRGIYSVIVSRYGNILKIDDMAVADADSATMRLTLPAGDRPITIRSRENAAWMAYRNTRQQYNQALVQLMQDGAYDEDEVGNRTLQTASILWSMQETFPNTIGGAMAAAESIQMLSNWNDSLAVARAHQIEPDNPQLVEVVRAARGAAARLAGQDSALALVHTFLERVDEPDARTALQSEIVMAYVDSAQTDEALEAIQTLKQSTTDTAWTEWADRVRYELEHLMPGMPAPSFTATTYTGDAFSLGDLRGRHVLLEFYRPENTAFQQGLEARNALYEMAPPRSFDIVSISLQPDTLLNEAFYEGRTFPGIHIIGPGGMDYDVAERYTVSVLPTRILIDPEGRIVSKYVGNTMLAIQRDVLQAMGVAEP